MTIVKFRTTNKLFNWRKPLCFPFRGTRACYCVWYFSCHYTKAFGIK